MNSKTVKNCHGEKPQIKESSLKVIFVVMQMIQDSNLAFGRK